MVAAAAFAIGCGGPCARAEDAAFEAAWRNDLQTMRRLIAQNPRAARAGQCDPPQTAVGRFVARFRWTGSSTVLHVAARQGYADFAALLLKAGADVDARNEEGAMPLHLAAQYGHDEVARVLLAANATVDARRLYGLTPLHVAAEHGRFPVVKRLLAARADVNARDNGQWTALHHAASEGHENIVRLLIAEGGDPAAADNHGSTPLQYAVLGGHRSVIDLLTAKGIGANGASSGTEALALAAREIDPGPVRLFLDKGVAVDSLDQRGWTPLQGALYQREWTGSEFDQARKRRQREVVELLLARGANVEVVGKDGNRPLHTAAMFGFAEIVELLVARGAEIDARNDWGWTPLHFAVSQQHPEVADVLRKHGADVNARNKSGDGAQACCAPACPASTTNDAAVLIDVPMNSVATGAASS
jgi:ankyrin repeat protein